MYELTLNPYNDLGLTRSWPGVSAPAGMMSCFSHKGLEIYKFASCVAEWQHGLLQGTERSKSQCAVNHTPHNSIHTDFMKCVNVGSVSRIESLPVTDSHITVHTYLQKLLHGNISLLNANVNCSLTFRKHCIRDFRFSSDEYLNFIPFFVLEQKANVYNI
jgi:hypothetical protein